MAFLLTRRQLLHRTALVPLAAGAVAMLEGCANASPACSDPTLQSAGEAHMRRTLEYVERAPDAAEQCSGCEFFSASSEGDCGHCEILNGAVSRKGYCTSWAGRG